MKDLTCPSVSTIGPFMTRPASWRTAPNGSRSLNLQLKSCEDSSVLIVNDGAFQFVLFLILYAVLLQALKSVVLYVVLSPYDNEQSDLVHRISADKKLEEIPKYK